MEEIDLSGLTEEDQGLARKLFDRMKDPEVQTKAAEVIAILQEDLAEAIKKNFFELARVYQEAIKRVENCEEDQQEAA